MHYLSNLVIALLIWSSCAETSKNGSGNGLIIQEIPTPCKEGGEPNLFVAETGQVYLSWVEYLNDSTDALVFSTLKNNQWTAPQTIATGSDWFVNWADFPSLVAYKDSGKSLAAHWLQKSAGGTYDYDVRIAQSLDGGRSWSPSFIPHRDSIAAEHGFVSMLPLSGDRIFATWLDGRNTKTETSSDNHSHDNHGHDHGGGAMTLRAAIFDQNNQLYEEAELDHRICDCCQTSATMTDQGIIVAYRDRSEDEIRDIYVVRQVDGQWLSPTPVFNDNWHITGCPVNGPSIKAIGNHVAIAWFSMPNGQPEVKVAFSNDSGASFQAPIRVDEGHPLGRVDIEMISGEEALVSWIEQSEKEKAAIKVMKVGPTGKLSDRFLIAASTTSRQSGFPVIAKTNNQFIAAWTQVDSITSVHAALFTIP